MTVAVLPRLRTERMVLRPVTTTDLPVLVELNSDPEVMTYILGRAATPEETAEEWERRLTRGRRLATEGARAMVQQAFADAGVERVLASTMAVNAGSRRVLEKVGLTHTSSWLYDGADPIPGAEHGDVGYELTRRDWQRTTARRERPLARTPANFLPSRPAFLRQ